jgi:hypothetical protein
LPDELFRCLVGEKLSGGIQQALDRLRPLLVFLFCSHELGRPSQRKEGWRADEKHDALARTRVLDLEVEIESLSGDMSTRIKQYQFVNLGSPQRSRGSEAVSRINVNAVPSQDAGADVASALKGCDEKNFLVIENRVTKWWWLVHPAPTKLTRLSAKGNIGPDSPPGSRGKSREMEKLVAS